MATVPIIREGLLDPSRLPQFRGKWKTVQVSNKYATEKKTASVKQTDVTVFPWFHILPQESLILQLGDHKNPVHFISYVNIMGPI